MLSFWLISFGGLLALIELSSLTISKRKSYLLIAFLASGMLSGLDIYLGPVGDAQRYHAIINQCQFSNPLTLCGDKLHEQIWGFVSKVLGYSWAVVYGYFTVKFLVRLIGVAFQAGFFAVFGILYSSYQLGNGMAEGTFFLLGYLVISSLAKYRIILSAFWLSLLTIAHFGNFPSWIVLLRNSIGRVLLLCAAILAITSISWISENVNKAHILSETSLVYIAIETKINQSIEEASTSYADVLIYYGFPHSLVGLFVAVILYVFPVLAGGVGIAGWLVAVFGTAFSLAMFRIAGKDIIMWILLISSIVVFSIGTYAPGVALRHKVPIFLLMCTYCFIFHSKIRRPNIF